jgi:hypothetical protein
MESIGAFGLLSDSGFGHGWSMIALACTGPHPHPATHSVYCRWVAEWGCGPVQAKITTL